MGLIGKVKKAVNKYGWAVPGMQHHYVAERARRHFEKHTTAGKSFKGLYRNFWFNNVPAQNVAINSASSYGLHGPTGSIVGRA